MKTWLKMDSNLELIDKLVSYLKSLPASDLPTQRLIELAKAGTLKSLFCNPQQGADKISNLAIFVIAARQIHGQCQKLVERLIFSIFRELEKNERTSFFFNLDTQIKRITNSGSQRPSALLFLDCRYVSLSSEEMAMTLESPRQFQTLSKFLSRLNDYEHFDISEVEVKQLFHCLDTLLGRVDEHSDEFVYLYNDLLARSSLCSSFNFEAD